MTWNKFKIVPGVFTPLHCSRSLFSIGTVQFSGSGLLTPVTSSGVRTWVNGTTDDCDTADLASSCSKAIEYVF